MGSQIPTSVLCSTTIVLFSMYTLRLLVILCVCVLYCQGKHQGKSGHSRNLEHRSRLELLKEISNSIDHGPEYFSHHKEHKLTNKKGAAKKKSKSGYTANTRHDQDNINLQRLDVHTNHENRKLPKTFFQMLKKKSQKPNKKMDKIYKKMMKKEKLRFKKEHLRKMKKNHIP